MNFVIYGANGYTGKLVIETAIKNGLKPVIAGRNAQTLSELGKKYNLDYLAFDLSDVSVIASQIKDFDLVLNCAGPFSKTVKPMVKACLETDTHYLDITGEIEVFEWVKAQDKKAKEKDVILMSGVGFDVVPTDCVADFLNKNLPNTTHLQLAFTSLGGSISHGTVSTLLENLGKPGAIREEHKIKSVPLGHKGMTVDFGRRKVFCMTIPWGDVSTAHHTTNIPNIEAYTGAPKQAYYFLKLQALINPILRTKFVKNQLQKYVDKNIYGPTPEQNEKGLSMVWGKATNKEGKSLEARLETPEGYKLTAEAAIVITKKVLSQKYPGGYHTPAGLFGYELLNDIEGCKLTKV